MHGCNRFASYVDVSRVSYLMSLILLSNSSIKANRYAFVSLWRTIEINDNDMRLDMLEIEITSKILPYRKQKNLRSYKTET